MRESDDGQHAQAVRIRRVRPDEAATYKAFRLRALADSPDAFGQTLAQAEQMADSLWQHRVTRGAAGEESLVLIAVDAATDRWLGMTGSYFEDDAQTIANVVSVWVAPEARRRGVGRLLQDAARAWAISRGAREQRLWVTNTNEAAKNLYVVAGFTLTGTTQPHPAGPHLHELEMARRLSR
jgi:GNAT superfamily N-acetyltransferase